MAQPLKIGLVIDTSLDTSEGVPQYVLAVGAWLSKQGHDVHYLAGETKRKDLPGLNSLSRNIAVRFNGTATTIPLWAPKRQTRRFMHANKFDVLHVQTPHHPLMAQRLILAADPHTAVLTTFHILPYGLVSRWGTRLLRYWLRPSLKRTDQMLAVSPAAARFEKWAFGLPAKISPNVVDYPRFHNAKPFQDYKNKPTIVFLGRLEPRKGCLTLLQAATKLRAGDTSLDFRIVICGKGFLQPQLEQFCRDNQLEEVVEFKGFVSEEDKPRYLASADIAVFPSSGGESFGIVLLEAMASGQAAVLAGDNPGYRSVMEGRSELLFDPKSPDALAAKLQHFLTDNQARKAAAKWGADEAHQYDIDTVGQQLLKFYHQALLKRDNL